MRLPGTKIFFTALLAASALRAQTEQPRALQLNLAPAPEVAVPTNDVRRDATVAAVERAIPSVANVATESPISVRDPFEESIQEFYDRVYGRVRPKTAMSIGSGVVIDEGGYLLTNDHVVRRANKIQIQLATTHEVFNAIVVAEDPHNDIALLKILAPPGTKFSAIKFAADDDVLLGETVVALGNPFGLGGSVSRGIVSSKSRDVSIDSDGTALKLNCLQTDAAINPGNSGGALINLHGDLIGLNSAIRADAQGIGFAIPVRQLSAALAAALTPESTAQLWFGARVRAAACPLVFAAVQPGSPAQLAGLKPGDTVLQVNGKSPRSLIEFNELLVGSPQTNVSLTVMRDGVARGVSMKLIPEKEFFNASLVQRRLGISLQEMTPAEAQKLGLGRADGFIVTGVEEGSPAASSLARGAVITSLDGQPTADLRALAKMLHAKTKGDLARLGVVLQQRQGGFVFYREGAVEIPVR